MITRAAAGQRLTVKFAVKHTDVGGQIAAGKLCCPERIVQIGTNRSRQPFYGIASQTVVAAVNQHRSDLLVRFFDKAVNLHRLKNHSDFPGW